MFYSYQGSFKIKTLEITEVNNICVLTFVLAIVFSASNVL
jgi:hypothetical protein